MEHAAETVALLSQIKAKRQECIKLRTMLADRLSKMTFEMKQDKMDRFHFNEFKFELSDCHTREAVSKKAKYAHMKQVLQNVGVNANDQLLERLLANPIQSSHSSKLKIKKVKQH